MSVISILQSGKSLKFGGKFISFINILRKNWGRFVKILVKTLRKFYLLVKPSNFCQ